MAVGPVRLDGMKGAGPGRIRRQGSGFALPAETSGAPAGTAAASPVAAAGLLALQDGAAAASAEPPAARAGRRVARVLDELRGMQLDLLRDNPGDPARRDRLQSLASAPDPAAEADLAPELVELIAAVRLRARLELARASIAQPSSI